MHNNGSKALITFLIVVIGALAISTGYLFAKNTNLEKNNTPVTVESEPDVAEETSIEPTPTPTTEPSAIAKPTPSPTPTSTTTKTPTVTGEKYTVKSGDTMYSIALKYKVNWIKLAQANGLTEQTANTIKVGQVLVIPSN